MGSGNDGAGRLVAVSNRPPATLERAAGGGLIYAIKDGPAVLYCAPVSDRPARISSGSEVLTRCLRAALATSLSPDS